MIKVIKEELYALNICLMCFNISIFMRIEFNSEYLTRNNITFFTKSTE